MPCMSGYEFLSVVRSQLPAIHVIAMSGAFSGTCVPPGVAADAFFEKGSCPAFLIKIVEAMTQPGSHFRDSLAWSTLRGFQLLIP